MSFQLLTALVAAAGLGLVGLTYAAPVAYFMCATLLALVAVSFTSARLSGKALEARREVSDRVFEEEPFLAQLEVVNRGRVPLFLLRVTDTLSQWLTAERRPDFVIAALWPGEKVTLSYRLRAQKRGVHRLGPVSVTVSDPFGLFSRRIALPAESLAGQALAGQAEAVIYPRPVPLIGLSASAGSESHPVGTGERARGTESGLDFYGIRDYQPGDDLRRIHWPATAHHAKLTVIEFDQGMSENVAIVLDTRAGTEFGTGVETTLEVAIRAAASLARHTLEGEGTVLLAADSAVGPMCVEVQRIDREEELLEMLARVEANGSQTVSSVLAWATPMLPPGARVWVLTAAPDAGLVGAAASMAYQTPGGGFTLLTLDPTSFDPRAAAVQHEQVGAEMAAAGATTALLQKGRDLGEALRNVLAVVP